MYNERLISEATKNNWQRLGLIGEDVESRLSKRANKRFSKKTFIPVEYLSDQKNVEILEQILNFGYTLESTIYSLGVNLLLKSGLAGYENDNISSKNPYIVEIFQDIGKFSIKKELLKIDLPKNERDFLGVVYQSMLLEGEKNKKGSYYTPKNVVKSILKYINNGMKFLDPCCGTGSFVLAASEKIENPQDIYGFDLDKIACFIAKINLILAYKDKVFRPNIFNNDFLLSELDIKFDIIATNPPWGAFGSNEYKAKFEQIKSGESFSYFINKCARNISSNGCAYFILPESILNVKVHKDIRKFILDNFQISEIILLGAIFSGVLSKVIALKLDKNQNTENIIIYENDRKYVIDQKFYVSNSNNNFSILDNTDARILEKIYSYPYQTLEDSIWGLGIVTGNNAEFITDNTQIGEKIYSGKNISKGFILETEKYINYERSRFQQVAPEHIYRAKEKLVYKFISKKLVFAYDDKQRLFLNSANILIPSIKGYSIKQIMDCLNSKLFQYIYQKKFNELKILKGNLCKLPFPYLKACNVKINDEFLYNVFNLSSSEISHIIKELE